MFDLAMASAEHTPRVTVHLCVPDDQVRHLPRRQRAPEHLHPDIPLPRQGDVIYLSPRSAWGVQLVVFDWPRPGEMRVEIWLQHVATTHGRPNAFPVMQ